jgi:hypothetical protein
MKFNAATIPCLATAMSPSAEKSRAFPAPRDFHECGAVFLFLRPVDLHQKRKKKKVEHYQQKPMLNFCSLVYCLEIRKERRLSAVPHV